jgi:hypothetical protein
MAARVAVRYQVPDVAEEDASHATASSVSVV